MTSRGDLRSPQGRHHARKSNAADAEKDQQIVVPIDRTGHYISQGAAVSSSRVLSSIFFMKSALPLGFHS